MSGRARGLTFAASVTVLAALTTHVAWADEGGFGAAERAAIEAVLAAQDDAWNRGDIEAFMEGYERSPELLFTSGGKVRRGWEETLARYRTAYGDKGAMGKLSFSDLEIRGLGSDAAVVLGRWRLDDTPKAGGGIFTLVFVRGPEGWLIVHDHTSSDPE